MRIAKQVVAGCVAVLVLAATLAGVAIAGEGYAAFVSRVAANPPAGEAYRADLEAQLQKAANAYRGQKGLPPLKPNAALIPAARAHAVDMATHDFVGHRASTGQEFESRMRALHPGVMMLPMMGENAARERSAGPADAAKAAKLFQQWVNSPTHARALRSRDFVSVATGVVEKDGKLYASQIFQGPELHTNMFGGTSQPKPAAAPEEEGSGLY